MKNKAPELGVVWLVEGGRPGRLAVRTQPPLGHREGGVTVAHVAHDPTRGEPAIICWFCAEEILPP